MEEIKKSCENCRHYIEHYVWVNYKFIKTCCGHCAINPLTKKFRKLLPLRNGCPKWENQSIKIAEREKHIEIEIRYIAECLNNIIKYFEREDNTPPV